jgi:hypothetical protein
MTQTIINLGTGGAVLNGQNGSTAGADSNDALFLDWSGLNHVYLPGVASNFLSVPDEAALDITGDIDIRVQVSADDWTPSAQGWIVTKWGAVGVARQSYSLVLNTNGTLRLYWTTDGDTDIFRSSTVATGLTDNSVKWVRATLDVNNGASGHDVAFYLSDDGATWTQLGTTVTTAGVTSVYSGDEPLRVGTANLGGTVFGGRIYRAQVFNGIDGTKVLDVDTSVITTGAATTFNALTGQTVTINRSTSGRKTVAVVSPVWLFGTDDYMEVADNDLLDFDALGSFTAIGVTRSWDTFGGLDALLSKRSGASSGAGYDLRNGAVNPATILGEFGGTTGVSNVARTSSSRSAGTLFLITLVRDVASTSSSLYLNSVLEQTGADTSGGSLANTFPFRVGRFGSSTEYADMELIAVSIFRRALTATEIAQISDYYQARLS